jgi:predicted O-methyltransferase YrrM
LDAIIETQVTETSLMGEQSAGAQVTAAPRRKLFALTMIRNEADLIQPFLAQASELFDKLVIADVQSTDGTREILDEIAGSNPRVAVYSVEREEKYQSAIMNLLARNAFKDGADWVFLIDGDEFLNVENREQLDDFLSQFYSDVMFLPWINLVPENYGSFTYFDVAQHFLWRGRVSKYYKIAISNLFASANPDFHIYEGNHSVSRTFGSPPLEPTLEGGLTLLHLPIRSVDRFKYKMSAAHRNLLAKHNRIEGEGTHVTAVNDLFQSGKCLGVRELNSLAANYGDGDVDGVDVKDWPQIRLPQYLSARANETWEAGSLQQTLQGDAAVVWRKSNFVPGGMVGAALAGDTIEIVPQPITGDGRPYRGRFASLPPRPPNGPPRLDPVLLAQALTAAFAKIKIITFSAWSELVPTLFVLFAILRPRRFVELGAHYGMSYFAACQASEDSEGVECVAVDNWVGDPHASFHEKEVYEKFSEIARLNFPRQLHIRANFEDAVRCFEDESIDLLHIDGYHTYEAVRSDFETWLPKMSPDGVIIFHDINVHERGFGVWRFWEELTNRYPSFELMHCHGLGILYVGREPSVAAQIMRWLHENSAERQLTQSFLEYIGVLSVEFRRKVDELAETSAHRDHLDRLLVEVVSHRDALVRQPRKRPSIGAAVELEFARFLCTLGLRTTGTAMWNHAQARLR